MLDIKFVRENPGIVKKACVDKKKDVDVDALLAVDAELKEVAQAVQELNQARNEAAKAKDIEKGKELKAQAGELERKNTELTEKLQPLLEALPNIPSEDTPIGKDESENVILREIGEKPAFTFEPKDHEELGKNLDIIDSERAANVAGARFTYLKGDLVLLQFALNQFAMSILTNHDAVKSIAEGAGLDVAHTPFRPVLPPLFIKTEIFQKMGRLEPREDRYYIESDDLFLIGSAEHTLGPLHMDEMLRENDLPIRYVAFTPAFRREAGTYGKDTRGIIRQHQFDKIEMESFCLPEESVNEQNLFVAVQEHLVQALGIPYRVMQICTGDMGAPDARQIDIECWMPGQNTYRETHTSDLMTDFQARRLKTRIKRNDGSKDYAHMNDATVLAMGRIIIAIMENYQQEDGSIRVPDVLIPYMSGRTVIDKAT